MTLVSGHTHLLMIKRNSLGHEIIEIINDFTEKESKIISDTVLFLNFEKEKSIKILKKIEEIGFIIRGYRYAYEDDLPIEERAVLYEKICMDWWTDLMINW